MPASAGERWDLTAGQLEIWHAQKLGLDSSLYNTGEYLEIIGDLDVGLFETAALLTFREAEGARIRICQDDELPQQYVYEPGDWQLNVVDFSAGADPQATARKWMQDDMRHPVNFEGWLFSSALFKVGPERFLWYYRAHHIAIDGFSGAIIAARQAQIYTLLLAGRSPAEGALEPISVLLESEAEYRNSPELDSDREFWIGALSDVPQAVSLNGQQIRRIPQLPTRNMLELDPDHATRLSAAARRVRTSLSGLLVAASAIYLHRWTGEEDIVLGLSALGRTGRQRGDPRDDG